MAIGIARRHFISALGGAAITLPLAARAQQQAMPVIGFLSGASATNFARFADAFRGGLRDTGYVEGRDVVIEYRWADDHYERLPEMAKELVSRKVSVLVATGGDPSWRAAKAETDSIPIIFTTGSDPVASGLVASLSRPGGNVTGVRVFVGMLLPKQIELLSELVPKGHVFGLLVNPRNPNVQETISVVKSAGEALGRQIKVLEAATTSEIETAFADLAKDPIDGLVIHSDPLFTGRIDQLVALVARERLPAVFYQREFATDGALASYGESLSGDYRQVGVYTGRILKGERPADLPVLQPTKFEFVINLKTAKSLGLSISLPILGRADEVIE
jgi:putative ABC transport system substrate-binding protein